MKKLLSVFLALTLVFALCGGALAAESETGDIVVLYTNDVHCAIDGDFGYSNLAAYEDKMAAEGNYVTLVDAGDAIQGAAYGTMSEGADIIGIMNAVGYDVATLGNHEFDYKVPRILELADMLECGYISANFIDLADGESVFPAYKLLSYGDVQVAYVGISTPDTYTKTTPAYFQDENGNYIYSFGNEDLVDYVQAAIDEAVAAGADYVIAVGHLGIDPESAPYRSTDVIPQLSGLDAFIDGHSHSVIASDIVKDKDGEDVILTSTGTGFQNFGKLTIDVETGDVTSTLINSEDFEATDEEIDAYLAELFAKYELIFSEVVAESSIDLTGYDEDGNRLVRIKETNIGDLCADAYRIIGGADIGLVNGGGIRADIAAGDISRQDIINVHPFGNKLCVVEATGQQILDALEMAVSALPSESGGFLHVSGLSFTVDPSVENPVEVDEYGNFVKVEGERRVSDVKVGDEAIDPEGTYTVASHNYMLKDGGDGFNMFMGDKVIVDETMADNEVLSSYIVDELDGVIPESYAEPQGRITILEAEEEDGNPYTDVSEGQWFYADVLAAYENGLMSGVSATEFAPDTDMSRAMLVTMLYRLEGEPAVEGEVSATFTDCADGQWYSDAVLWASSNKVVNGRSETTFDPNATMTRQEMATILYNYSIYKGAEAVTEPELSFSDADAIASWAEAAVAYCAENGLMGGVSETEFAPAGSASRAMGATVLMRIFNANSAEEAA